MRALSWDASPSSKQGRPSTTSPVCGGRTHPVIQALDATHHYAERALADKPCLLRQQSDIQGWWKAKKEQVRRQVREAATGPSHRAALQSYGALARNRYPMLHEPLRLGELLRHQTGTTLMRRLKRPAGPLKRIASDSLRKLRT